MRNFVKSLLKTLGYQYSIISGRKDQGAFRELDRFGVNIEVVLRQMQEKNYSLVRKRLIYIQPFFVQETNIIKISLKGLS